MKRAFGGWNSILRLAPNMLADIMEEDFVVVRAFKDGSIDNVRHCVSCERASAIVNSRNVDTGVHQVCPGRVGVQMEGGLGVGDCAFRIVESNNCLATEIGRGT